MAQKKLLPALILMVFVLLMRVANAGDIEIPFKEEDKKWLKNLMSESQKIAITNFTQKYKELLDMQNRQGVLEDKNIEVVEDIFKEEVILKIFISSSMGKELLKHYAKEAKSFGGILVFNGLPDNSWNKLNELVTEMIEDNPEVMTQIDPEEFDRFDIKTVPSFVLMREDVWLDSLQREQKERRVVYDKVVGNIGTKEALGLFASGGELQKEATKKLSSDDDV